MRSLPIIKATIEKELSLYPQDLTGQFGDDTVIRLNNEADLLKKLLSLTDRFIQEQTQLEQRLEAYI